MSQKDPSKHLKQTPRRVEFFLQHFSVFLAFLGPKNGCYYGQSTGRGSCNEKTRRIHFLVGWEKPTLFAPCKLPSNSRYCRALSGAPLKGAAANGAMHLPPNREASSLYFGRQSAGRGAFPSTTRSGKKKKAPLFQDGGGGELNFLASSTGRGGCHLRKSTSPS